METELLKDLKDFLNNRDPVEYIESLDNLLSVYLPSDEYAFLPIEERRKYYDCVCELKDLINRMIEIKKAG